MVDRGDVIPVRRRLAMVLLVTSSLLLPLGAHADQPCDVVSMPCTFEGLPFKLKVVDADTHQPVADVHALAEWRVGGGGGRATGPPTAQTTARGSSVLIS